MNDETGFRKCDSKDCDNPATHWMVWTKPQFYCLIHLNGMLNVADAIGYPTPATTVRALSIDEMMTEGEDDGTQ